MDKNKKELHQADKSIYIDSAEYGGSTNYVAKVNIDEEPELASEYDVRGIPLLIVFENGKIIKQAAGARPKQAIEELLKN